MAEKVQITIRGRQYTVRSDEEHDLATIAAYVDRKMEELSRGPMPLDDYALAMLAALNIASEFEQFRKEVQRELVTMDEELSATARRVEIIIMGDDEGVPHESAT
ncbi:MAG: cell division protein ZapA [Myxococcales bacterium]|nr:cell division protein ZapA [Myxococcales bacterium]